MTPKRKSKTPTRARQKRAQTGRTPDQGPAYVAVVRRGSTRRFARLRKHTDELPLKVVWDSRHADRRTKPDRVKIESRQAQRRHDPPFTWDAADFLVRKETGPPGATSQNFTDVRNGYASTDLDPNRHQTS